MVPTHGARIEATSEKLQHFPDACGVREEVVPPGGTPLEIPVETRGLSGCVSRSRSGGLHPTA
ncbi:MAG: hypothetical protein U5R31_15770 [Acidimicrobiia bacterium]|nr:hypothetical protein [Acidimicrobiia bacterium]